MPVPSVMTDLSASAASNSPGGSEAVGNNLDNYMRAIQAIIRSTNHKSADLASAASVAIGAAAGEFMTITGTTTITSFDNVSAGIVRTLIFDGALQLTHSTNIQLPGGANYTTTAGDVLTFVSLGSGQWKCVGMTNQRASDVVYKVIKTTNTARSSTITATADPELVTPSLLLGEYMFEGFLRWNQDSGNSQGIRWSFTQASAAGQTTQIYATASGGGPATVANTNSLSSLNSYNLGASVSDGRILISGWVSVTTAGAFSVNWAQQTSDASPTNLLAGSWIRLTKV